MARIQKESSPVNMVTVPVTRTHINEGQCGDPRRCALALALNDATGKKWTVIPPEMRRIRKDSTYIIYVMEDELVAWTRKFDITDNISVPSDTAPEIVRETQRDTIPEITLTFDLDDRTRIATIVVNV
jgi:hypothetical protein